MINQISLCPSEHDITTMIELIYVFQRRATTHLFVVSPCNTHSFAWENACFLLKKKLHSKFNQFFLQKALRAALYDQREHETRVQHTHQTLSQADRKIEQVSGLPSQRRDQIELEGSVRMKGHIEMTSPPSDLSSIDGNEEERTCHTPNSMASSSDENKVCTYCWLDNALHRQMSWFIMYSAYMWYIQFYIRIHFRSNKPNKSTCLMPKRQTTCAW